jgi:flavin reductase (DIM6/NTAB) family NADH-FMN oxidoreductase RutF
MNILPDQNPPFLQASRLDSDTYRRIAGQWLTGVTVVTTRDAHGAPVGLTMNAVSPLSLSPPMFLICLDLFSETLAAIEASRTFAINFLGANGGDTCTAFSRKGCDKFADIPNFAGAYGSPILKDAIAHVECFVQDAHIADDHKIVVGAAVAGTVDGGEPLAYFRGRLHRLHS